MEYQDFIKSKIISTPNEGFEVNPADIHPLCFPHQRDIIAWAAVGGRRAIFAQFGLGKSIMQLELARLSGVRSLIICPLGVKQEFKKDATLLGIEVEYVRSNEEVETSSCRILLTNYERVRDGGISPHHFGLVSLDEASVLRSYGSKTYQEFLNLFVQTPYRYVCTATPSPNRFKELIHYAGFLSVMDTGQALTRFFKRDSSKAGNLQLHPHKEKEFWLWVSSWAIFLTRPSDLGYPDAGYDLPELAVEYHRVTIDNREIHFERDGQAKLFHNPAVQLSDTAKEKRISLKSRLEKLLSLVIKYLSPIDRDPEQLVIFCHLNAEQEAIESALKKAGISVASVYGNLSDEEKERRLLDWKAGKYTVLLSKPEIYGSGVNLQQACKMLFIGIDYGFNDLIQSVHRIQRFGQKNPCRVDLIYTDSEDSVLKVIQEKWQRHEELTTQMTDIIKQYGLSTNGITQLRRSIGIERKEVKSELFTAVNNDCVIETSQMAENSVDLICTSIPFGNHYEYSASYNDFGHTDNDEHFFGQMNYLTPQLLRVLKPGRVAAIHVKDRILFGNVTGDGMPTVNPFHAKTLFHFTQHGFRYMGMITIETDVVRENNQTYRLGWSEQCKDGSKMGIGSPEYLLLFRKLPSDNSKAYADEPVTKTKDTYPRGQWQIDARSKWNSSGNRLLTPDEFAKLDLQKANAQFLKQMEGEVYDYRHHVEVAVAMEQEGKLPSTFETFRVPARYEWVWGDITRMRTLNSNQTQSREQNHICPFQLDVVERVINRWSNPGDLVYDPFAGLFTVPYLSIKMDRRGKGVELNADYFRSGVGYCKEAEYKKSVPTLFDDLQLSKTA